MTAHQHECSAAQYGCKSNRDDCVCACGAFRKDGRWFAPVPDEPEQLISAAYSLRDALSAALASREQPFTQEDVEHLRLVAGQAEALKLGANHAAGLRNLADRIEATLSELETKGTQQEG